MRRIVWACLLGLSAALRCAAAGAADFSGIWTGSFEIHFAGGGVENNTAWLVLQQAGTVVTGTAGPTAEQQAPIWDVAVSGNSLRFVTNSSQGKFLHFELTRDGDSLSGEANGEYGDDRIRAVVKTSRQGTTAAAPDALYQQMLALDTALFDSFNQCGDPAQLAKHAAFFAKDVEFYHDKGGLTRGSAAVVAETRKNVCGRMRRELDTASFHAFPIPGYGALTTGTHRFCHTPTTCEGAADFAIVWQETKGRWQVTRVLSYAHRALDAPAASQ